MTDLWEREIEHPLMRGALNMIQPEAVAMVDRIAARPSFTATAPPGSR